MKKMSLSLYVGRSATYISSYLLHIFLILLSSSERAEYIGYGKLFIWTNYIKPFSGLKIRGLAVPQAAPGVIHITPLRGLETKPGRDGQTSSNLPSKQPGSYL